MINKILLNRFIKYCKKSSRYVCYAESKGRIFIAGISTLKLLSNIKSFTKSNKDIVLEYDVYDPSEGGVEITKLEYLTSNKNQP